MYDVYITEHFKKQLKGHIQKDANLKARFIHVMKNFQKETSTSIGHHIYKLRLQRANMGKSGGYRLYVYLLEIENIITPLCIYAKNSQETIPFKTLNIHLLEVLNEIEKQIYLS